MKIKFGDPLPIIHKRDIQREQIKKLPKERRPMTDDEKIAASKIEPGLITYGVGTPDKRFARDISSAARSGDYLITEGQAAYLWLIVYRYRRQIKDPMLVSIAAKMCGKLNEVER